MQRLALPLSLLLLASLAMAQPATAAATQAEPATDFSSTLFLDASHIQGQDTEVDLTRLFLSLDHRFDATWSIHATTDIQWRRHQDPSDLWLRYAYLQGDFGHALQLRLGSALMPWPGLVNRWYGYRFIEPAALARAKAVNAVDWGAHAAGTLGPAGQFHYAVAVVTGAGYQRPRLGNGPDTELLAAWQPSVHSIVALGTYSGTLAQDTSGRPRQHHARRDSVLVAWADATWRVGGHWFRTRNWNQVTLPGTDHGHGWSAWASWQWTPAWSLFTRHDHLATRSRTRPDSADRYSNAGLAWHNEDGTRLALAWKRHQLQRHGQTLPATNEVGLWAQLKF